MHAGNNTNKLGLTRILEPAMSIKARIEEERKQNTYISDPHSRNTWIESATMRLERKLEFVLPLAR